MSGIPFKQIPSNQRAPLFYAELDASKANTSPASQRTLLIGQKTQAGTLAPNVPVVAQSSSDTRTAAGPGSVLAGMIRSYRENDPNGEMWVLPLADDPNATAATGQIVITSTGGPRTLGTISLYIAGRLVSIPIAANQVASAIVAVIVAAVNALPDVPVVATAAGTVPGSSVTFTAKNAGLTGNDIDLRINYLGAGGGEVLPTEVAIAVTPMANGAGNPSLTVGLANLLDTSFDFIVCSLTDAASMASIAQLLSDVAPGRWSWATQVFGHAFIARRDTAGGLAAFATGLNNQHISCIGYADSPTPPWRWAAALAGAAAVSLRDDPGVPLQTLTLTGVLSPPIASRFSLPIRNNTLLYGGVSTWTTDATGSVVLENVITTYVTNAAGQPDDSYLEVETLFLLAYVLRRLRSVVTTKFARVKLAADGTRVLPGTRVVTPSTIRAEIIAAYREMEGEGMVQNSAAFAAGLVVQQNATNPNRVDVELPIVLIAQLRVFAALVQFRLS
jgi:phage tail sheath gpL-like